MAPPAGAASAESLPPTASPSGATGRSPRLVNAAVFVLSWLLALAAWELVSRSGLISQTDLPAMSTTMQELWSMAEMRDFWVGRPPHDPRLGARARDRHRCSPSRSASRSASSDFAARAFRVPIEFLRPIPSAVLIPLLFLTLGSTLESEVFLAAFGAFWPLLVQTMYGVHDVDPVATDTARSFGLGPAERLYRVTLPSAVPYIATGMRIASTVALILAFTAELFMGTPGLGAHLNLAQSYGLTTQVYALALATGALGLATYVAFCGARTARASLASVPTDRGRMSPRTVAICSRSARRSPSRLRSSSAGSCGR